tara:strand:+ start:5153 stop:5452 length:300 start_codon:yes stop_codon:yes gene_type:complete
MLTPKRQRFHPVQNFVQTLGRDHAIQEMFAKDPKAVFAEFGLSDGEIAGLQEGTFGALDAIDLHPVFRMHWLMMSDPEGAKMMDVTEFLPVLQGGKQNG